MKKTQNLVRSRTRLPNPATLALWPLVRKYGDHLRERQRKPNSIVTVQGNLKRFCAFITAAGHRQLADITPLVLEGYQLSLAPLTLRSQQQYLVDVRQFFRWLEQSRQLFEESGGHAPPAQGAETAAQNTERTASHPPAERARRKNRLGTARPGLAGSGLRDRRPPH